MKKCILLINILFATSAAWAALITDDFNRLDQNSNADGSLIGSGWVNSDGSDRWAINGSSLRAVVVAPPAVLYNTGLGTGSSADRSFTLSVDVAPKVDANVWSGVVFNYQNSLNYYMLRFKVGTTAYQLNRVINGAVGGPVFADDATTTFSLSTFYTLTVSSTTAYEFDFTITEAGSSTVLNPITTAIDTGNNFTDGYAGVYSDGAIGWVSAYDNFSLTAIPEPTVLGMLGFVGVALISARRVFMI